MAVYLRRVSCARLRLWCRLRGSVCLQLQRDRGAGCGRAM